jgi:uncharacterized protein
MTQKVGRPHFRELNRDEAEEILTRNHIGRLGFQREDTVEIMPIHYVYEDQWIFGRTVPGPKLDWLRQHWWVAFQVDEIDALFEWRSVLVHGGFYRLLPEWSDREEELWKRARRALQKMMPDFFTDADPVSERTAIFAIAVQQISGRAAEPEAAGEPQQQEPKEGPA